MQDRERHSIIFQLIQSKRTSEERGNGQGMRGEVMSERDD